MKRQKSMAKSQFELNEKKWNFFDWLQRDAYNYTWLERIISKSFDIRHDIL